MIFTKDEQRQWSPSGYVGIDFCWLYKNPNGGGTALLCLQKNASLPQHKHPGWEQIYVLSGKIRYRDTLMVPGDHVITEKEETHYLVAVEPSMFLTTSEKDGVIIVEQ